jgi:hypothetical protein
VPRQLSRDDEQRVDANIVSLAHVPWRQPLGSDGDAPKPIAVERDGSRFLRAALSPQ